MAVLVTNILEPGSFPHPSVGNTAEAIFNPSLMIFIQVLPIPFYPPGAVACCHLFFFYRLSFFFPLPISFWKI